MCRCPVCLALMCRCPSLCLALIRILEHTPILYPCYPRCLLDNTATDLLHAIDLLQWRVNWLCETELAQSTHAMDKREYSLDRLALWSCHGLASPHIDCTSLQLHTNTIRAHRIDTVHRSSCMSVLLHTCVVHTHAWCIAVCLTGTTWRLTRRSSTGKESRRSGCGIIVTYTNAPTTCMLQPNACH